MRLRELGLYPKAGTPAQAAAYIMTQPGIWGGIVREIGIQPK
jgi:hypothetical protein